MVDAIGATVLRGGGNNEGVHLAGQYTAKCFGPDGNLKWEDTFDNVVTDVGANWALNQIFGTQQTITSYMGLISSVGYVATPPAVGNTMGTHTGWNEAGNGVNYPMWASSSVRATLTWSAAATRAKALTSAASFVIAADNGGGTVKGCFIVGGTGGSATNADTGGILYSAGFFTGGDKVVGTGDTLQVSYSTSM